VPIVLKSGSLNFLEPSGPVKACNGIALPYQQSSTIAAEWYCASYFSLVYILLHVALYIFLMPVQHVWSLHILIQIFSDDGMCNVFLSHSIFYYFIIIARVIELEHSDVQSLCC
jgi:hypothetical protein